MTVKIENIKKEIDNLYSKLKDKGYKDLDYQQDYIEEIVLIKIFDVYLSNYLLKDNKNWQKHNKYAEKLYKTGNSEELSDEDIENWTNWTLVKDIELMKIYFKEWIDWIYNQIINTKFYENHLSKLWYSEEDIKEIIKIYFESLKNNLVYYFSMIDLEDLDIFNWLTEEEILDKIEEMTYKDYQKLFDDPEIYNKIKNENVLPIRIWLEWPVVNLDTWLGKTVTWIISWLLFLKFNKSIDESVEPKMIFSFTDWVMTSEVEKIIDWLKNIFNELWIKTEKVNIKLVEKDENWIIVNYELKEIKSSNFKVIDNIKTIPKNNNQIDDWLQKIVIKALKDDYKNIDKNVKYLQEWNAIYIYDECDNNPYVCGPHIPWWQQVILLTANKLIKIEELDTEIYPKAFEIKWVIDSILDIRFNVNLIHWKEIRKNKDLLKEAEDKWAIELSNISYRIIDIANDIVDEKMKKMVNSLNQKLNAANSNIGNLMEKLSWLMKKVNQEKKLLKTNIEKFFKIIWATEQTSFEELLEAIKQIKNNKWKTKTSEKKENELTAILTEIKIRKENYDNLIRAKEIIWKIKEINEKMDKVKLQMLYNEENIYKIISFIDNWEILNEKVVIIFDNLIEKKENKYKWIIKLLKNKWFEVITNKELIKYQKNNKQLPDKIILLGSYNELWIWQNLQMFNHLLIIYGDEYNDEQLFQVTWRLERLWATWIKTINILLYSTKKENIKQLIKEERENVNFNLKQTVKYQFSESSVNETISTLEEINDKIDNLEIEFEVDEEQKEELKEQNKEILDFIIENIEDYKKMNSEYDNLMKSYQEVSWNIWVNFSAIDKLVKQL